GASGRRAFHCYATLLLDFGAPLDFGAEPPQSAPTCEVEFFAWVLQRAHRGDPRPALERTVAMHPGAAMIHLALAKAANASKESQRAQGHAMAALAVSPESPAAANNLAYALEALGNPVGAAAVLRRALQIEPDHVGNLFNLASICEDRGEL